MKLKGWLSKDTGDGKRRPAVVFLHGGWAFGAEDWRDAAPFAEAGFALFMPMLRAENGNPGVYEAFYSEVDDAIAAGRHVASLPYVDPDNVFVAGHSVGAVLAVLTAMMPSPYKAAAALDGYLDIATWGLPAECIPFNPANADEVRIRNPMAFIASLRCPLILFAERELKENNESFATQAKQAGKRCELVIVPGDHQSMVAPSVKQAIERFRQYTEKSGQ